MGAVHEPRRIGAAEFVVCDRGMSRVRNMCCVRVLGVWVLSVQGVCSVRVWGVRVVGVVCVTRGCGVLAVNLKQDYDAVFSYYSKRRTSKRPLAVESLYNS